MKPPRKRHFIKNLRETIKVNQNPSWGRRITNIVVHWPGVKGFTGNTTQKESINVLNKIDKFHKSKDWGGGARAPRITYHYAVDLRGRIFQMNDENSRTWHAGDANGYSIGVLVLYGTDHSITKEEERNISHAFDYLARKFYKKYGIKKRDWKPHSHFKNTQCCGDQLRSILALWSRLSK